MKKALLAGCGKQRLRLLSSDGDHTFCGYDLVTIDNDPSANADILMELGGDLPFQDDEFDELHMYEVLEHLGVQGDWLGFFDEWAEYWRILKPGGRLHASVPALSSPYLWGDPGHRRAVSLETMHFLSQEEYLQCGVTPMTDYRHVWKGDFKIVYHEMQAGTLLVVLEAIKPARTFSEDERQAFIERLRSNNQT